MSTTNTSNTANTNSVDSTSSMNSVDSVDSVDNTEMRQGLRSRLFDEIPSGIMVLDSQLQVVDHNRSFGKMFGDGRGSTCHAVTRHRDTSCTGCPVLATFADGKQRVIEQSGSDRGGRAVHYLVQVTPIDGADGRPQLVAAITTDLTSTRRLQHEYQTLFEKVPCFVAVINRDHRVVKANEAFRRVFGSTTGEPCHRLYKRRAEPCPDCPVDRTFADGRSHSMRQLGVSKDGRPTPYLVFTAPLVKDGGGTSHVIEMALDMTEHDALLKELGRAEGLRRALVESSLDAIVVFGERARIQMVNRAAERLLGMGRDELRGRRTWPGLMPREVGEVLRGEREELLLHDSWIRGIGDEEIPVRLAAVSLRQEGTFIGAALIAQDLREFKRLQREKVDAERLAAVGQTVAGLAHGIKNIITGLEGGLYVSESGMKRGDQERVRMGWEMLGRNVSRISELSKNLLAFSRGEQLRCVVTRPDEVVRDVVELYRDRASQHGIELVAEVSDVVAEAWMDSEGLHSCLANLISNAVDACLVSDNSSCRITVRLHEKDQTIVFEVIDTGCGMDYEVKQRAFTSFFTTKGRGGTGLGLLLTRKIVQQHGGAIELTTEPGTGTCFKLSFPRDRLPKPPSAKESHHDSGVN